MVGTGPGKRLSRERPKGLPVQPCRAGRETSRLHLKGPGQHGARAPAALTIHGDVAKALGTEQEEDGEHGPRGEEHPGHDAHHQPRAALGYGVVRLHVHLHACQYTRCKQKCATVRAGRVTGDGALLRNGPGKRVRSAGRRRGTPQMTACPVTPRTAAPGRAALEVLPMESNSSRALRSRLSHLGGVVKGVGAVEHAQDEEDDLGVARGQRGSDAPHDCANITDLPRSKQQRAHQWRERGGACAGRAR